MTTSDELAAENLLLRGIIDLTSGDLDVREVARRVATLVTSATESDACFVHIVDETRDRLVLMGATPPFDNLVGTIQLAFGEGVAGWVAAHAEPVIVPDKWQDPRYRYIPELRGEDYSSMLSAPLLARGIVVGVINVHARQPRAFGDHDLIVLGNVANLLARAIENARLYARLAEREVTLERFASRTVEVQEMERRRLAGEIHDGISQPLISVWFHLLAAEDAVGHDHTTVQRELGRAKELATVTLDEARRAIAGLRPSVLDDLGLGPSLESLAASLPGVDVELAIGKCELAPHVEVALYRIAQEALQNVVKHASADRVQLRLAEMAVGVQLVIVDDGRGFDPEPRGDATGGDDRASYGLVGMRERAELIGARIDVSSAPGAGTTVAVLVPRTDVVG